jgi:ABC-type glycerol-3-phosphate transport system permease component
LGLLTLLLVQMFPQLLAVVAIFLLMSAIGDIFPLGLNSQIGLIMVYLGGALGVNTFLMYGFFNTVPASIDEAAKIDGAGHARIFFTIILRLVAPVLAVIGLLSFIGTMNDFLIASVILVDPDKQTLASVSTSSSRRRRRATGACSPPAPCSRRSCRWHCSWASSVSSSAASRPGPSSSAAPASTRGPSADRAATRPTTEGSVTRRVQPRRTCRRVVGIVPRRSS